MAGKYTELYYHLVWAVKGREPRIREEHEARMYGELRRKCRDLEVFVYAIGGVEDHVHLVVSIPPRIAVSTAVKGIKGASSHFFNAVLEPENEFHWQPGYGVLTFAKRDVRQIVAYVQNQKQHHRDGTLSPRMEYPGEPDNTD